MRLSNNFVIKGAGYFSSKFLILSRRYIEPFNARISSHYFLMILSFTFVIFLNKSFFSAAWNTQVFDSFGAMLFYISLFPLLWLLTFFSFNLICIPGVIKPLSIFLLISGSLAAYFMDTYGVVIDKEMLRNAWETDAGEWLKVQQSTHNTAMIYVSDHGESLGENNLYLHGMPYAIAPYLQKHVPFIFWASPAFYRDRGLNKECLESSKMHEFSHDNIFHSVLGLLDINTPYYESHLDIFSSCL